MKESTQLRLKIADTVVSFRSLFPQETYTPKEEEESRFSQRFTNFDYSGKRKADIAINVKVVKKLPKPENADTIFITYHPDDGKENWRLLKKGARYIYQSPLKGKEQVAFVNADFNRADVFLLPDKKKGFVWDVADVIYDFLQVLMINYFAKIRKGIFTHAVGIKDLNGNGLLFAGESGAGKSTTARIWHRHSRALVLNDDRVIATKKNNKFYIYGSPWHGEFTDYLESSLEPAALSKIFFLHHSFKNQAQALSHLDAFKLFYPAIFPAFWDGDFLGNIVSFSQEMLKSFEPLRLGFVKDKSIISFVRGLLK